MGATPRQTADMISTILFVAGINTLIQTSIGDRLPILQGASFSYLPAAFSIVLNENLQSIQDDNERFHSTMRILSGSLIVAGFIQTAIGYSGIFPRSQIHHARYCCSSYYSNWFITLSRWMEWCVHMVRS